MIDTIITTAPEETLGLGIALGRSLTGGEVISLTGDLGAGKTVFAKGIAKGLGVSEEVTSPTFQVVREYKGRLPLYHFDFYRLADKSELREIGFSDYIGGENVVVVEWADLFVHALPKNYIHVSIGVVNDTREITIQRIEKD